jgi:hypothetical protein
MSVGKLMMPMAVTGLSVRQGGGVAGPRGQRQRSKGREVRYSLES